jgi:hypothetical protein
MPWGLREKELWRRANAAATMTDLAEFWQTFRIILIKFDSFLSFQILKLGVERKRGMVPLWQHFGSILAIFWQNVGKKLAECCLNRKS